MLFVQRSFGVAFFRVCPGRCAFDTFGNRADLAAVGSAGLDIS